MIEITLSRSLIAFSLAHAYDASNNKRKEEKQWGEIINKTKAMNP